MAVLLNQAFSILCVSLLTAPPPSGREDVPHAVEVAKKEEAAYSACINIKK